MRDHAEMERPRMRGNRKIERLNRTNNERLRADKTMITEKTNTGLSRLLFVLPRRPKISVRLKRHLAESQTLKK